MQISQVTTVMGRKANVESHIQMWLDSGVDEVVLVDWNCNEHTGAAILQSKLGSDPRLTIVRVPDHGTVNGKRQVMAGNHFHLTKARNTGALAARHELLFFLDADCWASPALIQSIKEQANQCEEMGMKAPDLLVGGGHITDADYVQGRLPTTWTVDGQCFVHNAIFRRINGYCEEHWEWGGESYDLYWRILSAGGKVGRFIPSMVHHAPHPDDQRQQHLLRKWGEHKRENVFGESLTQLEQYRRLSTTRVDPRANKGLLHAARVTPGATLGFSGGLADNLRLFRGGRQKLWRDEIL
jgi:hypothetical protein